MWAVEYCKALTNDVRAVRRLYDREWRRIGERDNVRDANSLADEHLDAHPADAIRVFHIRKDYADQ